MLTETERAYGISIVTQAAEWLDNRAPGWERKIDLGRLNIRSCQNCILGQSLKEFTTKMDPTGYGVGERWLYEDRLSHEDFTFAFACTQYESVWRELIKERFSSGNLSDAS